MKSKMHSNMQVRPCRAFAAIQLFAACLFLTPPLMAQTGDSERELVELSPFSVETDRDYGYRRMGTVTASRIGANIIEIPTNISIISGEFIEDLNFTEMTQTLRYNSSVEVDEGFQVFRNSFKMRGFIANLYRNGTEINRGNLGSDGIDRIEVVKGPVGLFYGTSNPNGIINVVSKRPQFLERSSIDLSIGSYGFAKGLVDWQTVISDEHGLAARMIGSYQSQDNRVDFQESNSNFLMPTLTYRPNRYVEVNLEFSRYEANRKYSASEGGGFNKPNALGWREAFENPPADVVSHFLNINPNLTTEAETIDYLRERWSGQSGSVSGSGNYRNDLMAARNEWVFSRDGPIDVDWAALSNRGDKFNPQGPYNSLSLINWLGQASLTLTPTEWFSVKYDYSRWRETGDFMRSPVSNDRSPVDPGLMRITLQKRQNVNERESHKIDAAITWNTNFIDNTFGFGWEEVASLFQQYGWTIDPSLLPDRVDIDGTVLSGQDILLNFRPAIHDYINMEDAVSSGRNLLVNSPTRADGWYLSHRGKLLDGRLHTLAGYRRETVRDVTEDTISLGAIYGIIPGIHAFASFSEVFNPTNQLATGGPGAGLDPNDSFDRLANETGEGYDVGFKFDWRDNTLSGTISIWEVKRDGLIVQDFVRQSNDPRNQDGDSNTEVRFFVNAGTHRSRGFDADLIWTPMPNYQAILNYTYMWEANVISDPSLAPDALNRDVVLNRRFEDAPEHNFSFWNKYTFTEGNLSGAFVGAGLRYRSKSVWNTASTINLFNPAETKLDVLLGYSRPTFGLDTTYTLNVSNLTDERNDLERGNGREAFFSVKVAF